MYKQLYQNCIHRIAWIQNRAFSSYVAAFDTSMNPKHWPFNLRDCSCNDITSKMVKRDITISGWVDSVRLMKDSVFIVVRDGNGKVQTLFDSDAEVEDILKKLPLESSVCVQGTVQLRPDDARNPTLTTGDIEIKGKKLFLLNPSSEVPFPYHGKLPKEEVLAKYRHLALRHPEYMDEIKFRSSFFHLLRNHITSLGFTEVETPLLTRSSPEGAHELYVPTALIPRGGFALSQSPQQYKQILMASGIDRYFQIARCFRNESGRKDRQLEFTQLDLELSYISRISQITGIVEDTLKTVLMKLSYQGPVTFQEIEYEDAMKNYGSDKPDLRIPFKLTTLDLSASQKIVVLKMPQMGSAISNSKWKQLLKSVESADTKGLRVIRCVGNQSGQLEYPVSAEKLVDMKKVMHSIQDCKANDLILVGVENKQHGNPYQIESLLGKLRVMLYTMGQQLKVFQPFQPIDVHSPITFLWVKNFPLFEYDSNGTLQSCHHPFTAPLDISSSEELAQCTDLTRILSSSCDLVLNGNEVGGGSIRIHNYTLQHYIMKQLLGLESTEVFDHLLNALKHGCPPHGGFAIGLDRLLCILRNRSSIREVIAFPKTIMGADPLTSSPSLISDDHWKEVGF